MTTLTCALSLVPVLTCDIHLFHCMTCLIKKKKEIQITHTQKKNKIHIYMFSEDHPKESIDSFHFLLSHSPLNYTKIRT